MSQNQIDPNMLNNLLSQINPNMLSNILNNIDPEQLAKAINNLQNTNTEIIEEDIDPSTIITESEKNNFNEIPNLNTNNTNFTSSSPNNFSNIDINALLSNLQRQMGNNNFQNNSNINPLINMLMGSINQGQGSSFNQNQFSGRSPFPTGMGGMPNILSMLGGRNMGGLSGIPNLLNMLGGMGSMGPMRGMGMNPMMNMLMRFMGRR